MTDTEPSTTSLQDDAGWQPLAKTAAHMLSEGQRVWVWSTGSLRHATILSIAKTRIRISFEQKDGYVRERMISIGEVLMPCGVVHTVAPVHVRTHHNRRTLVIGNDDVVAWTALDLIYVRNPETGQRECAETWTENARRNLDLAKTVLAETRTSRPGLWRGL